jgi:hypothetical protein
MMLIQYLHPLLPCPIGTGRCAVCTVAYVPLGNARRPAPINGVQSVARQTGAPRLSGRQDGEALASSLAPPEASLLGLESTLGAELGLATDGAWTDGLAPGAQAARAAAIARIAMSRFVMVQPLGCVPLG